MKLRDPSTRLLIEAALGLGVCIGFGRFSVGLLLPAMQDDLDLGYASVGLLASANFAAYFVGVAGMPALTRRLSHRLLLQTGLFLAAIGMLALTLPLPSAGVAAALVLTGASGALGWVSAAAIGIALAQHGDRGRILGFIGGAMGLGMITASALTLLASRTDPLPWRALWGIQGAIALVALLVARTGPPLEANVRRPRQGVPGIGGLRFAYGLFGVGYAIFATYFVTAVSRTGADTADAAARWGGVGLGACVGAYGFGRWSDHSGRRPTLVASQVVALVAATFVISDLHDVPLVGLAGGFLFGSVMTGMASLLPATLADQLPEHLVADAFASLTLLFAMSQAIAPSIGGALLERGWSFSVVFGVVAGCFAGSAAAFGRFTASRSVNVPDPPAP